MKLYDLLQFGVCVLSLLAAGFWLRSATTTLPNTKPCTNFIVQGLDVSCDPFPNATTLKFLCM